MFRHWEESDFQNVRTLLAYKRADVPHAAYFDGVLDEFHRRQRATLIKPQSAWTAWWENFGERLASAFQTAPARGWAAAAACALLALGLAVFALPHGSPSDAALASGRQPRALYAFSDDANLNSSDDQRIDKLVIGESGLASEAARPHYVMTGSSAPYDASLVF